MTKLSRPRVVLRDASATVLLAREVAALTTRCDWADLAEVEDSDDGMTMSGRTGWTVFSFGEIVEIRLQPDGDGTSVTVSSEQRLRVAVADLGRRNRRNVGTVMNSIATRLAATG